MIRVERPRPDVVRVVIDRPQSRNAMSFAMWERLREVAAEIDADASVRAAIVTGAGTQAFVSGTDIGEFRAFEGADDGVAYEHRIERVARALEAIRVPTIAAIAGACTGGGMVVAAACDVRIGAPGLRVGLPIARTLGNCISLPNIVRVAGVIGRDAAKALLLTGELLDAQGALRVGFVTEVVATDDILAVRADEIADRIVALAPLTLRATKEMCRRLAATDALPEDDDLIRLCYGSRDFREGVEAFADKRSPRWTGL